ncbi:hypothetical protein BGX28_001844 [Mortierella sp. GBA30]|nr:hypothetical protein BGX28_001844 [Mortierella sp. GBA30]
MGCSERVVDEEDDDEGDDEDDDEDEDEDGANADLDAGTDVAAGVDIVADGNECVRDPDAAWAMSGIVIMV